MAEKITPIDNSAKKEEANSLLKSITELYTLSENSSLKCKQAVMQRINACITIVKNEIKFLSDEETRNNEQIVKQELQEQRLAAQKAEFEKQNALRAEKQSQQNLKAGHNRSSEHVKVHRDDADSTVK